MNKSKLAQIALSCIQTEYINGWESDSLNTDNLPLDFERRVDLEEAYEYTYVSSYSGDRIVFISVPNSTGYYSVSFFVYPA